MTQKQLLVKCVFSVRPIVCASETWTRKKDDHRMLLVYEMKCYRNMVNVGWQERKTNESIKKSVQKGDSYGHYSTQKTAAFRPVA